MNERKGESHMSTRQQFLILLPLLLLLATCADYNVDHIYWGVADLYSAPIPWDDSGATKHLNVATVCMQCDLNPDINRQRINDFVIRIMEEKPETRLIVFGETILGWYYKPDEAEAYQRRIAESVVDGPTRLMMSSFASMYDVYIAYGISEKDGNEIYNSLVLLDPSGDLIALHHKYFFTSWDVEDGFTPGKKTNTAIIDDIKVGLSICKDVNSTYLAKEYSMDKDIKIMIYSAADTGAGPMRVYPPARAYNKWFISANRIGDEILVGHEEEGNSFDGYYEIIDPAGYSVRSDIHNEGYLYYRIGVYQ